MDGHANWVLAFDASCATCRQLAQLVRNECGEQIDIRSLNDEEVQDWRRAALGAEPPWAPTLIRIHSGTVSAWTGSRMAVRLVRRLGPGPTLRLLRTFGELRERCANPIDSGRGLRRKEVLRLGAGAVTAAAFVVLGKTPAFADPVQRSERAQAWVRANPDKLPRSYDGLGAFDVTYRQAIHQALPAADRARLWTEHLKRRAAELPKLSTEQAAVLDRALALAAAERTFTAGVEKLHAELDGLRESAIAAFGVETARTLLATLGPDPTTLACCACGCSTQSDFCTVRCIYDGTGRCNHYDNGCGSFWQYPCNGCCSYCGARGCC
ncbi:hypothetical protein GCM10022225_78700 [Plantactinospora mayteni]|uniref:Uncharacterized protein n=1 Tax=Plantactinospora mayteni TaxID=566021 RepID=A0ABQ4F304_9ACTN|nr:bacteriocin fulvocin C-related protein [Plantactinospora mayteni]GIH01280.1 hypothetical protein Pma05_78520 [Plantactinospora mayteni]